MRRQPKQNQPSSSNERKSAGNTWKEQEDLFFGTSSSSSSAPLTNTRSANGRTNRTSTAGPISSTSTTQPYSGMCSPCTPSPETQTNSVNDAKSQRTGRNWSAKFAASRNAMARVADSAASRISNIIDERTRPPPPPVIPTMASLPPASRQRPSSSSSSSRPTPPPTASSTSRAPPPTQRRRQISQMVQTALVSQIPLPCKICNSIPLAYQCHPFFGPKERICTTHDSSQITKCVSCFRYEPTNEPFHRIGTSPAKVCPACARTAILDNAAATSLYWEILEFLSTVHGLTLFEGKMESVPVQLVSEETLNQKSSRIDCNPNAQKRGLCVWSESHLGIHLPSMPLWMTRGGTSSSSGGGGGVGDIPTSRSVGVRHVNVQAIYCLKGLPRSLMGSILAHEALHAWFGLNPLRRDGVVGERSSGDVRRIPPMVEEGLCQLSSHLYLNHVMDSMGQGDSSSSGGFGGGPSDDTLREYFRWSIETDSSPVYGDGFRMAAMAYNEICDNGGSFIDLLQYAMMHKALP